MTDIPPGLGISGQDSEQQGWNRARKRQDLTLLPHAIALFCPRALRDLAERFKARQSMSRKGDCWDNAVVESIFLPHPLKVEALSDELLAKRQQPRGLVFHCIEAYYNRKRLHSPIGCMMPEAFELQLVA